MRREIVSSTDVVVLVEHHWGSIVVLHAWKRSHIVIIADIEGLLIPSSTVCVIECIRIVSELRLIVPILLRPCEWILIPRGVVTHHVIRAHAIVHEVST